MFPYFVFGILVMRPFELHGKWRIAIPCGIFLFAVVIFEGNVRTNGMSFYWVPSDWRTVISNGRLFLCFWARTAVGITGGIFILWIADKLIKLVPWLANFAVFGTTTLGVYVIHEWPLIQVHKYFQFESLPSCWRWPLTLVLFMGCHYVIVAIKRYRRLSFVFFGDEKWLASKVNLVASKCYSR